MVLLLLLLQLLLLPLLLLRPRWGNRAEESFWRNGFVIRVFVFCVVHPQSLLCPHVYLCCMRVFKISLTPRWRRIINFGRSTHAAPMQIGQTFTSNRATANSPPRPAGGFALGHPLVGEFSAPSNVDASIVGGWCCQWLRRHYVQPCLMINVVAPFKEGGTDFPSETRRWEEYLARHHVTRGTHSRRQR